MARRALPGGLVAQVDRVLEQAVRRRDRLARERLVYGRVTDGTFIPYHLSITAEVLAVMAAEAALRVVVADVVRMCLPVGLHLGKEIRAIDALYLGHGGADGRCFCRINLRIGRSIVIVQLVCDPRDRLVLG